MDVGAAQAVLMYFVLSLWLAAGFADYLCHRASSIETTSGGKESLLHLLQFGEMAIPVLAAIFLEINALIILIMIVCLILHEATAIWDVSYAYGRREITPTEQHVHSFLEMLPLMGTAYRGDAALATVPVLIRPWQRNVGFRSAAQATTAAVALRDDDPVRGLAFRGAALSGRIIPRLEARDYQARALTLPP